MSRVLSAEVKPIAGRPTLLINGAPHPPLIYALSDCPGARYAWEEVPQRNVALFYQQGIRVFQVDLWLRDLLTAEGGLELELACRQVDGITAVAPDAAIMMRLHLNPTDSWCRDHRAECVGYADADPDEDNAPGLPRPLVGDGLRPLRASFYSRRWQEWAHARLKDFCIQFSSTRAGDAVCALQVAYGVYGEWHQFGFLHHDPDTGPAATEAWRSWLRKRYATETDLARVWGRPGATWASVIPPDSAAREKAAHGVLRDPKTQRQVVDYFEFLHEELTATILGFGRAVKRSWPRPIVTAAFFGYFYSLFGREAAGAQLAVEAALKSPDLDCWCSPQSYANGARSFGGAGSSRGLIGVVRRAGKLWLDEMDTATSAVGCPWEPEFKSNLNDDVAIHRRNVLQPVTRGGGQWWYDFGPIAGTPQFERYGNCGWWDSPRLQQEVAAIRDIVAARQNQPFRRPADILVVHDPMSFCHTVSHRHPPAEFGQLPFSAANPISSKLVDELAQGLLATGLAFDEALLSELAELDLAPFRLIIFATTPVLTQHDRRIIRDRVAVAGRHVMMLGFAGWSDGDCVSGKLAGEVSGIPTELLRPQSAELSFDFEEHQETIKLDRSVELPVFENNPDAVIARWQDGSPAAVCRSTDKATWHVMVVPPSDSSILRALALRAGCHAFNSHPETTLIGDGLIIPHTIDGGPRKLQWPEGPVIQTTLDPRSTTVFDGVTGECLLR